MRSTIPLLGLVIGLVLGPSVWAQDFRWSFKETFEGNKPHKAWPEEGVRGSHFRRVGQTDFSSDYAGAKKFVLTEDGDTAVRSLLPKGDGTPVKFWRWGFEPWGGKASESDLLIEFQIRYSANYEFPDEQHILELFYDQLSGFDHEYDGPKLIVSLLGSDKVRVHAFVPETTLKTGITLNTEKIGKLPSALERDKWHSFRIHAKLNTAPKPKDRAKVLLEEIPIDGSITVTVDGKLAEEVQFDKAALRANNRAWTSVVWAGSVNRADAQKADCYADFRRFSIGSPK